MIVCSNNNNNIKQMTRAMFLPTERKYGAVFMKYSWISK
jgi:hypothetical protein